MICSVFQCNCRPTICPQIITVSAGVLLFAPWVSSWSLVPAPKGNNYFEWWSGNADFCQVLSRGPRTFLPRACHSLSGFLRIDISVMWQFHKFRKSVLWGIFKVLIGFAIFLELSEMWPCLGYCRWGSTINWYSDTSMFSALALSLHAWASCAAFIGTRQHELPSLTRYWDLS